jgi:2-oxo-4-hydroxy-4-carboxy-5-ureidoimidazoline decarboxylase
VTDDVVSKPAHDGPVSAADALSIDRLDVVAPGAFAAAVAPLFEGARGFLGRLAVARPFGSVDRLFDTARQIAHAMPVDEQIELIDAHPRLGASPGSVSALSFAEQGYDRVGTERAPETAETPGTERAPKTTVAAELERLNDAYEAQFGFRYCVFVAGRSRAALLPELAAALEADRAAELARALDAVVDIARDRYATMTSAASEAAS